MGTGEGQQRIANMKNKMYIFLEGTMCLVYVQSDCFIKSYLFL